MMLDEVEPLRPLARANGEVDSEAARQAGLWSDVTHYEQRGDAAELADAYRRLGSFFDDQDDYRQAVLYYERSAIASVASGDAARSAKALWLQARGLRRQGRSDLARAALDLVPKVLQDRAPVLQIELLLEEAELLLSCSNPDPKAAEERCAEALWIASTATEDHRLAAIAKHHLGRALFAQDELARAKVLFNEAAYLLEAGQDREFADLLDDLGSAHIHLGDHREAVMALERGLALDRALRYRSGEGRSLLLLGRAKARLSDVAAAAACFALAIETFSWARDDAGLADAYHWSADFEIEHRQLEEAERHLIAAEHKERSFVRNPIGLVRTKRRQAQICRDRGLLGDAADHMLLAQQALGELDMPGERSWLLGDFASLDIAAGNFDDARAKLFEASAVWREFGNKTNIARFERRIGQVEVKRGEFAEAHRRFALARALLDEQPDSLELEWLLDDIAEAYLTQGKRDEARRHLIQNLEDTTSRHRGRTLLLLGKIAIADGQRDKAYEHFANAKSAYAALSDSTGEEAAAKELFQLEHDAKYVSLLEDLHRSIAGPARANFATGQYAGAVQEAFKPLERQIRELSSRLLNSPVQSDMISRHIKDLRDRRWDEDDLRRLGVNRKLTMTAIWDLCAAGFELLRNPASHGDVRRTFDLNGPADTFAALGVAHLIARELETLRNFSIEYHEPPDLPA